MGMLGIAIASGVLILGTAVTAMFANKAADDTKIYGATYISIVNDKEAHKRDILLATMVFLIGYTASPTTTRTEIP